MPFFQVSKYYLLFPLCVLGGVFFFLLNQNALSTEGYLSVQKAYFFLLNERLSEYPNLFYNLTQLGDAFVTISLLSISFIKFPKMWKALISASIISLLLSKIPKTLLDIPRPAAVYAHDSFTIVGKTLMGYSSFPSGHSITIFTWVTLILLYWMPKNHLAKILWLLFGMAIGLLIAFSRVAVGAHHPLDVICGSAIGIFSSILGILLIQKYPIFDWMDNKKLLPLFGSIFSIGIVVLCVKIVKEPLAIFALPFGSLLVSIYLISRKYVAQKIHQSSPAE